MFIARTRFGWLPPIVLMPAWEKPTADSSRLSSAFALLAMVVLVVENESRIDRMFCAASEYACGGLDRTTASPAERSASAG